MKLIFALLRIKKGILNNTFMLMSINKKIFSKNQNCSTLSSIKKNAITILKILN